MCVTSLGLNCDFFYEAERNPFIGQPRHTGFCGESWWTLIKEMCGKSWIYILRMNFERSSYFLFHLTFSVFPINKCYLTFVCPLTDWLVCLAEFLFSGTACLLIFGNTRPSLTHNKITKNLDQANNRFHTFVLCNEQTTMDSVHQTTEALTLKISRGQTTVSLVYLFISLLSTYFLIGYCSAPRRNSPSASAPIINAEHV